MLQLTKRQEVILANRYWNKGESYPQAKRRRGFKRLSYQQWNSIISFYSPAWEIKASKVNFGFENKPDDNSTYVDHLTDEQLIEFNARKYCFNPPKF